MTSHQFANMLLEMPEMELFVMKTEKKNELIPVVGAHLFETCTRDSQTHVALLSQGQKVTGNLYWHGNIRYVPSNMRPTNNTMKRKLNGH